MGSLKALTIAGVVAVAAVQTAHAADLLPPPPPIEAPLRGPIEESGFYLRGDLGVGFNEVYDRTSSFAGTTTMAGLNAWYGASNPSASYLLGIGAGYKFNNWFRADVTGEYRGGGLYRANNYYTLANSPACDGLPAGTCGDKYAAQMDVGLFLLNGYLDLGTWSGFTPYVGAGVGVAAYSLGVATDQSMQTQVPNGLTGFGVAPAQTGVNFAWALMGGVSFDVAQNLKLDVGYRYVNMGQLTTGTYECNGNCWYEKQHFALASQDVRVGLRYMLGAQAFYEPGVRAKY